ncbi:hypothetical protein ACWERV_27185 [Streptomyces sp. NPDC004031]
MGEMMVGNEDGLPAEQNGGTDAPRAEEALQRWVERFRWLLEQTGQPAYVYAANHDLSETQVSRWRNGKTMPTEFAVDDLLRSLQPALSEQVVEQTWELWREAAKTASRYEYEKYMLRQELRRALQQLKNVGAYAETLRDQHDAAQADVARLRRQVEELQQAAGRTAVLSQLEHDRKDQRITELEAELGLLKAQLHEAEQDLKTTDREIEAVDRTEARAADHADAVRRQLRALEEATARQLPPGHETAAPADPAPAPASDPASVDTPAPFPANGQRPPASPTPPRATVRLAQEQPGTGTFPFGRTTYWSKTQLTLYGLATWPPAGASAYTVGCGFTHLQMAHHNTVWQLAAYALIGALALFVIWIGWVLTIDLPVSVREDDKWLPISVCGWAFMVSLALGIFEPHVIVILDDLGAKLQSPLNPD